MELVHLLLGTVNGETCFLCYKETVNSAQSIHSSLEVKSQLFNETLSLADMIFYLFPSFELTLTKACNTCTDFIIKMYITIQRNSVMKKIIKNIINIVNKKINGHNCTSIDNLGRLDININLSKIIDTEKNSFNRFSKHKVPNINNENFDKGMTNQLVEEQLNQEYKCPNCYKSFNSIKKYKKHIKSHSRKYKKIYYNCTDCNYKSLSKQSLQGHMNKKHLKIRPHVCTTCYKNFYHKKNLVEHEKCHVQVRNEICEICGDSFIHKKNLLEHLKLHSGERPYHCEICNKRFITSGRRSEHVKRCHSEKTECCLLCDKKFSLLKELTRHMKALHS